MLGVRLPLTYDKRDLGVEMGLPKEILYPEPELKEPVITLHEKRHEYLTQEDLEKKIRDRKSVV